MYLEYLEQALTLGIFWCGLLFAILAIVKYNLYENRSRVD
jgi:hypothetical protein